MAEFFNLRLHVGRQSSPTCEALPLSEHNVKEYSAPQPDTLDGALKYVPGTSGGGEELYCPHQDHLCHGRLLLSLSLPSASLVSFNLRAGILYLQYDWGREGGIKLQQTNTPDRQTSLNAAAGGTHSTVALMHCCLY